MNKAEWCLRCAIITIAVAALGLGAGCEDDDSSDSGSAAMSADTGTGTGESDAASSNGAGADTGVAADTGQAEDTGGVSEDTSAPDDVGEDTAVAEDTAQPPEDTAQPPEDTTEPPEDTALPPEDTSVPEDTGGGEDVGGPAWDCAELCTLRDNDEAGLCNMEGYFGVDVCTDYCEAQVGGWDAAIWEGFSECVEFDPLCFQSISQCMFFELYEDVINDDLPLDQTVVVEGADFGAFTNRWLYAEFSVGFGEATNIDQTRVRDGAFGLRWDFTEVVPFSSGVRIAIYIDVNENLSCDPDADAIFGGEALPVFGTEPLEYRLDLDPSMQAESFIAESVCTNSF